MNSKQQVDCPTCGTPVEWDESSRFRPFCSRRCRLIDLGDWLGEQHRIAGEPAPDASDGSSADRDADDDATWR
jgi:endogenous inhibitor of DNA gyrase (YacG/DUF329 family)